ncbi:hypothetical protein [Pontibacter arcticus]|uniref:Coproporphyrinogen III oxidase n=1 Tax=Pontibacter arcticus TaxID=2080288 RepID=A0A364RBF9_9BACT|nr:hypothetical protein [Pontibacter arcticus]RAU81577.1 hypothetical protein DP923_15865 [Pontibacter arcticus]
MKKLLKSTFAIAAVFAFTACDNQNNTATETDTATEQVETQTPSDVDGGLDTADMDTTMTDSTMMIEE